MIRRADLGRRTDGTVASEVGQLAHGDVIDMATAKKAAAQ